MTRPKNTFDAADQIHMREQTAPVTTLNETPRNGHTGEWKERTKSYIYR